jgi:hypothetical protein
MGAAKVGVFYENLLKIPAPRDREYTRSDLTVKM